MSMISTSFRIIMYGSKSSVAPVYVPAAVFSMIGPVVGCQTTVWLVVMSFTPIDLSIGRLSVAKPRDSE